MMYHLFLDTFWKMVKIVKTSDQKSCCIYTHVDQCIPLFKALKKAIHVHKADYLVVLKFLAILVAILTHKPY